MRLGKADKQPADTMDYDISYAEWLRDGESLTEASATVSPDGLSLGTVFVSGSTVKVWLSGGALGVRYKVEVTVATSSGVIRQDEFFVAVKEY